LKVKDFMTRDLTSLSPESTLKKAVSLLSKASLTGVPVVDKELKVVGFVSEKDIIQIAFPSSAGLVHDSIFVHDFSRILQQLGEIGEKKVDDAMTSDPIVTDEEKTDEEVAEIMLTEKIKILPVVRPKTKILAGVVTRSDLLKALFEKNE